MSAYPDDENSEPLDEQNQKRFQEITGSLIYLSRWTRPDITTTVGILGRYASSPTKLHMKLARRILGYLHLTKDYKLELDGKSPLAVIRYSDADWANDHETRKSTSGYIILVGNSRVICKFVRQKSVASSTMESELMAMSDLVKEKLWVAEVLKDLQIEISRPVI
jgi:hypothetical protein